MNPKYEIFAVGDYRKRIKALRDIPEHNVKAGDEGGLVDGLHNLSQYGACWIDYDSCAVNGAFIASDAYIAEQTVVRDNAVVGGCAIVKGSLITEHVHITGVASVCLSRISGHGVIGKGSYHDVRIVLDDTYLDKIYLGAPEEEVAQALARSILKDM